MTKDFVTDKKATFGDKRSKALNSTRRTWKPNLQKMRILVNSKLEHIWVPTRTLKSGKATCV